jgi:capsular exopolysaccharide synthesis family protein
VTLGSYLRILRERWRLVTFFTLLSVGLAALVTALTPRVYQASAQVFVAPNAVAGTDAVTAAQAAAFLQAQISTYARLIDSPDVLDVVRTDLNLSLTDPQLKSKIDATTPTQSTIIYVTATDESAFQSAALANSAARAFVKTIERYATPVNSTTSTVHLIVAARATAPSTPISPKPVLNIALGLFVGLLVGLALAVARELLDNRIKDPETLAKIANSPTMGLIVEDARTQRHPIASRAGPRNLRAENFRKLRANLQFANVDRHPRIIAVTSSIPGEGKTTVAINLAYTLAEAGFTACLVDADLRRPMVGTALGLPSAVGLTSVLIHRISLSEAMQPAGSNLYVLTSGPTPPNPSEVLASSYVRDVIRSLLERVDYVVLDTAPLLPVADGSEVAALADGTLLVARYRETTDAHVRRAAEHLKRVDAALIGTVLNRVPVPRTSEYQGYAYYRYAASERANGAEGNVKGAKSGVFARNREKV